DRYDDQGSRDYDRVYDFRIGSGRRAFGRGYRRDDEYRGGGDHYEDRYDRWDDRSWSSRDDYSRDDYRQDDRGPLQRPKLNLKPRSTPKEGDSSASTSQSSRAASIFGGAKPVDTAAREREVEERLQKEQEKLQGQLDEPKLDGPRERHPSWQTTSENETLNKEDDCHSPTSKPPKPDQPLKVMPAPPPKENVWVKRSPNPPALSQTSDTEQQSPSSGGGKVATQDENKMDGVSVPKGQTGNSSHGSGDRGNKDHWKESDRKDGKKDQDSRSAPEPKKSEENPASKFSSVRKYAALSMDGEDENEGDYTE
uniref:Eukaryotic translation initiation factor 4B n=1 Tax=Nannospalax galili TaxID=1026970 RepID=A0A8C6QCZ8_NANGA